MKRIYNYIFKYVADDTEYFIIKTKKYEVAGIEKFQKVSIKERKGFWGRLFAFASTRTINGKLAVFDYIKEYKIEFDLMNLIFPMIGSNDRFENLSDKEFDRRIEKLLKLKAFL